MDQVCIQGMGKNGGLGEREAMAPGGSQSAARGIRGEQSGCRYAPQQLVAVQPKAKELEGCRGMARMTGWQVEVGEGVRYSRQAASLGAAWAVVEAHRQWGSATTHGPSGAGH